MAGLDDLLGSIEAPAGGDDQPAAMQPNLAGPPQAQFQAQAQAQAQAQQVQQAQQEQQAQRAQPRDPLREELEEGKVEGDLDAKVVAHLVERLLRHQPQRSKCGASRIWHAPIAPMRRRAALQTLRGALA